MGTTTDVVNRRAEALSQATTDALRAIYAPDATVSHPLLGAGAHGVDELLALEGGLFDSFSDREAEVRNVVDTRDWIAVQLVMRATNTGPMRLGPGEPIPATGRRIELPIAWFMRVNGDGSVTEDHTYVDSATFMAQLGLA